MKFIKGIFIAVGVFILGTIILGMVTNDRRSESPVPVAQESGASAKRYDTAPEVTSTEEPAPQQTASTAPSVDYRDMKLGDEGMDKSGALVCLPFVKRASAVPTALGPVTDVVGSGNEVILAYVEYYNDKDKNVSVSPSDITCYADNVQVSDSETYIKVESDGVKQCYDAELLPGTKAISVQEFIVPMGWNTLTLFVNENCYWTLSQNDVVTSDYNMQSVYPTPVYDVTPVGTTVYEGDYNLIYQGMKYFQRDTLLGEEQEVICKFRIENTGSSALDMSLVGHAMKGYLDGVYIDDNNFTLDENIDGYTNVFDVDSIAPGMSSDIYVAFNVASRPQNALVWYDDGFIISGNTCYVYGPVE